MARLAETKPRMPFYDQEFGLNKKSSLDLSNLPQITFKPHLVFVMMSFKGEEMSDVYLAIKDECAKLGLNANRVDENVGSVFIIREIATMINEAEFIICDLTHERPNVYYELGYAHGVGNHPYNILLVAKEGTNLHFDIAPLRVQYYRSTEHLRSIISGNLKQMIEITREVKSVLEVVAEAATDRGNKLPLVMALKHLHIRFFLEHLSTPLDFSRSVSLMQGDFMIPHADERRIDTFLRETSDGVLPEGVELMMLRMSCPGWPEDVLFAPAGITAFGAKDINKAKSCAQHALRLNRNCTLASQLVRLLLTKTEVRCPFGSEAADAPNVPAILAAED